MEPGRTGGHPCECLAAPASYRSALEIVTHAPWTSQAEPGVLVRGGGLRFRCYDSALAVVPIQLRSQLPGAEQEATSLAFWEDQEAEAVCLLLFMATGNSPK